MINKLLENENVVYYKEKDSYIAYYEDKIIFATNSEILKKFIVKLYLENVKKVFIISQNKEYYDLGFKFLEAINEEYELLEIDTINFVLGSKFKVIVDKPVLTVHSYLPDTVYEINEGIIDYEESFIEVYITGIYEAIDKFEGYVIGIISYKDKDYKKWIINKELIYNKQAVIDDLGHLEMDNLIEIEWL